jgi:hypothetical protein
VYEWALEQLKDIDVATIIPSAVTCPDATSKVPAIIEVHHVASPEYIHRHTNDADVSEVDFNDVRVKCEKLIEALEPERADVEIAALTLIHKYGCYSTLNKLQKKTSNLKLQKLTEETPEEKVAAWAKWDAMQNNTLFPERKETT